MGDWNGGQHNVRQREYMDRPLLLCWCSAALYCPSLHLHRKLSRKKKVITSLGMGWVWAVLNLKYNLSKCLVVPILICLVILDLYADAEHPHMLQRNKSTSAATSRESSSNDLFLRRVKTIKAFSQTCWGEQRDRSCSQQLRITDGR